MPFYEYHCHACGHEIEILQKMSDQPLVNCPECMGDSLKKKISAAGFQLKGTGWYETDFKNSGSKADKKEESKNNIDGKSSAPASADKKTADKKTDTQKTKSSASQQGCSTANSHAA